MQCSDGTVPWERSTTIPVAEAARQFIAKAVVQVGGSAAGLSTGVRLAWTYLSRPQ
jgi:hypothetical protein